MASFDQLASDGRMILGRHPVRPRAADPLAGAPAPARWLRRLRLKEWIGFFVAHPEWSVSFIMQDAKIASSSDLFAFHHGADRLEHHRGVSGPGSLRLPPVLSTAPCRFSSAGYELEYRFGADGDDHGIHIAIDGAGTSAAVSGELVLHPADASAPLSVAAELPRGSFYTWKQIFGVDGELRVGRDRIVYEADRDLAIVDEHRSLLPYRTDWTWGTFAFRTDGGFVGANFAARPQRDDQEEESALWFPGVCEPLADVSFRPTSDDPLASWRIESADRRLAVTFTPDRSMDVGQQLGVFAVDYVMRYGTYDGVLVGPDGEVPVTGVRGVCETMHARL